MATFSPGQEAARRLLDGPQRYACLVGGTRSGKTFLILRAIITRALRSEGSRHAILRFHANAARASIALDSLPNVMRSAFPKRSCGSAARMDISNCDEQIAHLGRRPRRQGSCRENSRP